MVQPSFDESMIRPRKDSGQIGPMEVPFTWDYE
jgi:hypothetical protein